MTDENEFRLSRRQALGALGTIGVASAGAGLGTSAFFSDQETFDGNELTAGALDLKVDWEEHYHLTNEQVQVPDGNGGTMDGVLMNDPKDPTYVGFPDPQNPMVWVHTDAIDEYMDMTALEAYPDQYDGDTQNTINNAGGDGIQDGLEYYDACNDLADTPEDLDPNAGKQLRTANGDTLNEDGSYKPLVALDDVKPGDFGELTLSFHLCDNPGYIWMNGGLTYANENGHTEPEAKDPDEKDGVVELLDEVQTMLWYDEDGDNVYEPGGVSGEVDVVLVLDRSGSMSGGKNDEMRAAAKNLVDALNLGPSAAQVGVVSFADQERLDHGLSTDATSVKNAIDGIGANGGTNIEGGVNGGEEELRGSESGTDFSNEITPSGDDRTSADKVMVVLSDGSPNQDDNGSGDYSQDGDTDPVDEANRAKNNGVDLYTIGFGISSGDSTAQTLEDMASDPKSSHAYLGGTGDLTQIFGQISQQISGEEQFFRGSLRELLNALSTGTGIPLDGDRSTSYDEVDSNKMPNGGADPNRDCFVDSTTNAVGLAWWLPVDHANEIQTDGAGFDLGFYTEQCRHNDGAGMGDFVSTRTASGWAKLEENFNGDGSIATSGHARRGETSEELELRNTGDTVVAGPVNHDWPGTAESFSYDHDGSSSATFAIGGDSVSSNSVNPPTAPSRVALQTKADEATMTVENVSLEVGGSAVNLSGPTSVVASNDDDGSARDIQYLVFDTNDLDLTQGFKVTGDITVEDHGSSSNEGYAFDVVVE